MRLAKEPSPGPVGGLLRGLLRGGGPSSPQLLALLFAADRLWHLLEGDLGLVRGDPGPGVLVLDRYKYSSIVYQSVVRLAGPPAPRSWVELVNAYAPPPHILVILEVDPGEALRRVEGRGGDREVYEEPGLLGELAGGFRELAAVLEARGEALVEWRLGGPRAVDAATGGEPLWAQLLEPCAYPEGRYPRVIRVETTSRSVEDVAAEIRGRVVGELLRLGLLEEA